MPSTYFQHAHEGEPVVGTAGREGEATIAGHDGRDAVPGRARGQRIPGELGVVVRMRIDEAGGDHVPARVDFLVPRPGHPAHFGDPAVQQRHVAGARGRSRAIDNGPAPNHQDRSSWAPFRSSVGIVA